MFTQHSHRSALFPGQLAARGLWPAFRSLGSSALGVRPTALPASGGAI